MASESISVHLVTPQGPIADEMTDAVLAPGRLGQFEILEGHVPFLSELHAGVLTFGEATEKKYYAVGPGFLEVEPNGVVQVLCEQAQASDDIDKEAATADRDERQEKLSKWEGALDAEYRTLKTELDWAEARLDTLKISGGN
ncbi:MAG: ATP synthase F1 subunit epsilon [Kofleriaceae bacterium]|nr:ATP synthase F1 subunit epsilon [Kofleriaceae bacterium]